MKLIGKEELLPTHYTEVGEPSYTGKGNHSVLQLEEIVEQYKELVHQLRLREQAILNKFSIAIVSESDIIHECKTCGGDNSQLGFCARCDTDAYSH